MATASRRRATDPRSTQHRAIHRRLDLEHVFGTHGTDDDNGMPISCVVCRRLVEPEAEGSGGDNFDSRDFDDVQNNLLTMVRVGTAAGDACSGSLRMGRSAEMDAPSRTSSDTLARLFFIHVPKTAGTSLRATIGAAYETASAIWVYPGEPWATRPRDLADLPAGIRSRAQLVFGHMPFGQHRHFEGGFAYATVLRRPADRLQSLHAHFVRSARAKITTGDPMTQLEALATTADGLSDLITGVGPAARLRNHMTRLIAGNPRGLGHDDPALLTLALDNIRAHFVGVGFTESLAEFVRALAPVAGWPQVAQMEHRNVGDMGSTEGDADLVARHHALDFQLYERVFAMTAGGTRLIAEFPDRPPTPDRTDR